MTMGWHTVMEFEPVLLGCIISSGNRSFEMIKSSKDCVINVPTVDIVNEVVCIGNSTSAETDEFAEFKDTPAAAAKVKVPLVGECYANFACKIVDAPRSKV